MEDPIPTNNKTCSYKQKSDCPFKSKLSLVNTSTTKNYYRNCEEFQREIYLTITCHHLEINHVRKAQSFLATLHMGIERKK